MKKFHGKKGINAAEYVLIAVLFAVFLGIAIFQMSPDVLRKFFVNSVKPSSGGNDLGTLQLQTMGE